MTVGKNVRRPGDTRWAPRLERLEARETPAIGYGINAAGTGLVRFDTAAPSAGGTIGISGLASGSVLKAIDFNTANNVLVGVEVNTGTNVAQIGAINLTTGLFTPIGGTFSVTGSNFGLAANGLTGQMQLVS